MIGILCEYSKFNVNKKRRYPYECRELEFDQFKSTLYFYFILPFYNVNTLIFVLNKHYYCKSFIVAGLVARKGVISLPFRSDHKSKDCRTVRRKDRQTDRQKPDKVIPMCRYDLQATQKRKHL